MTKTIRADFAALDPYAKVNAGLYHFLTSGFAAKTESYDIVLDKTGYFFFKQLPSPFTSQVSTHVYTSFQEAKTSVESRSTDNDKGHGKEEPTRLVYGAVMSLAYDRKLKRMTAADVAAAGKENVDSFLETNKKIRRDFAETYGKDALTDITQCLEVIAGERPRIYVSELDIGP